MLIVWDFGDTLTPMKYLVVFCLCLIGGLSGCTSQEEASTPYTRSEEIYGRTYGLALTLHVFTPRQNQNGAAIVVPMSEGWYSDEEMVERNIPIYIEALVAEGYTVFAVLHGSNPKFSIPENIEQLHRAIRYVRYHAKRFGIDPERIGMTGDSAGGHLSLMLGCASEKGNFESLDSIDRTSSEIQAAVAFFPPTDFLNFGEVGKQMLGEHPIVPLKGAFDFHRLNEKTNALEAITDSAERVRIAQEISPLYHVHKGCVPTLLVVGDADVYIPPQQSKVMKESLAKVGVPSDLVIYEGGKHDATTIKENFGATLAWFETYLLRQKSQ